ncbi:anti-sigma factor [Blastococcus sp. TF02A-35]|uniref:anti-sigma factor n=1 Tax=Blastococcus sp. TF02A-35 TaxID=2559612 RepID=UPI00107357E6|nr:anti-sigma factor [Blastococcus sp. TF02A_35]TFV46866.1 anti-sigma factor [Blastococcus sp. TF02A_35]
MTGEHAYDELAVGWALHALEPDDEAAFVQHLAGCERCLLTVAQTTEVMGAMARDLPATEPSPQLRSRLRAAVEATEQLPPPAARPTPEPAAAAGAAERTGAVPVPRRPASRSRVLTRALAAAAVAAVVGLGTWTAVLSQSRDDLRSTLAAQEAVVAELTKPGPAVVVPLTTTEEGDTVTLVARDEEVHVVTEGLERNDVSAETYVLWGLGRGEPVALGTFDVERPQIAVETVGSGSTGLDEFPGYGISIEPGREAPSAPTGVVASGQVES